MPMYLTPGVSYEQVDLDSGQIVAVRTDVAAFVGIGARGALNAPTQVSTWEQFQSTFGTFIPQGYLAYTVKAFFENGGNTCFIVRVASATAATATDGSAVQPPDGSASVVESVDGFAPGAIVTVRRDEQRQFDHMLQGVNVATRELIWAQPLEAALLGAALDFSTGPSDAEGILVDATGSPTLGIEASSPGTWGNGLLIGVAHSSLAATVTSNAVQPPDRKSSLVQSITGIPTGSLVKVFQDHSPSPLISYKIVSGVDPGLTLLRWDSALDAAYNLAQPISIETVEFSLSVTLAGQLQEIFTGMSLIPTHAKNVEQTINGVSQFITVRAIPSITPFPDRLPDPAASNLKAGGLRLRSGRDGIAGLRPRDFTGSPGDPVKVGIRTLEDVDPVAMVAVPDILIQPVPLPQSAPPKAVLPDPCSLCPPPPPQAPPPPPPLLEAAPSFTLEEIFLVQQEMVDLCENLRDRIAILDPPVFSRGKESVEIAAIQSWRQRFDSKYAALYFPWCRVYDPLQLGGALVRDIPPSGHATGTCAHVDLETGVHRAPANVELSWIQDVAVDVDAATQGILNPMGINCIRSFRRRGLRIYGARTVSSDPQWIFVNVRRLMMMIEKTLDRSLQWAVFEPNNYILRQNVAGAISSFLEAVYEAGALAGASDAEAFYVKCDAGNNPPELGDVGEFLAEVGVAPAVAAEFVVFRVGRTQDRLEITE